MKTLACLFCLCLLGAIAAAQTGTLLQFKAVEHVIDESGHPIVGALAIIGYYTNSQSVTSEKITGTNGVFEFQDTSPSEYADYSFEARKDGYYSIWQQVNLQSPYDPAKWNVEKSLVLKKVEKPIAMYAKKYVMGLKLPEYNKQIGFDLMIGDFVGPYGKGINSDILFTENHPDEKSGYTFTIGFPKEGDGIQEFTLPDTEKGSGLRSPHEAPVDGYQPKQEQTQMPDPNRNYFFRVRTVKDHEGNIVSAHYGKIYGDFMQFTYYLNPTPNDRNIEFDPKQNLLTGLDPLERVTAP